MVTDSPYDINDLVLSPFAGIMAGLIASLIMLVVVMLFEPYSGVSLETILTQLGTLVLPKRFEQVAPTTLVMIGLGVHLLLRGLSGLLYSVCQQKVPTRGFVAVGIFYGFFIWITGSVILGFVFGAEWRATSRTWTWLFANIIFGFTLALTAIIADKIRPTATVAVPKD